MTYILVIWTIVGFAGTQLYTHERYDWRPIGEFHNAQVMPIKLALEMCEEAAKKLELKPGKYQCIRSK